MKFTFRAIAAAALVLAISASAHASTVVITYQGIVWLGTDHTGVFGTVGQDMAGLSYTATYTLTEGVPGVIVNSDASSGSLYSGSGFGASTAMSAMLTINGVTQSIAGSYAGAITQIDGLPAQNDRDLIRHDAEDMTTVNGEIDTRSFIFNLFWSDYNDFIASGDFTENFAYVGQGNDVALGGFGFYQNDLAGGPMLINAAGSMTPQSVNVTRVSSVPEPTTWVSLLFGFGLIGAIARKKGRHHRWHRPLKPTVVG